MFPMHIRWPGYKFRAKPFSERCPKPPIQRKDRQKTLCRPQKTGKNTFWWRFFHTFVSNSDNFNHV